MTANKGGGDDTNVAVPLVTGGGGGGKQLNSIMTLPNQSDMLFAHQSVFQDWTQ